MCAFLYKDLSFWHIIFCLYQQFILTFLARQVYWQHILSFICESFLYIGQEEGQMSSFRVEGTAGKDMPSKLGKNMSFWGGVWEVWRRLLASWGQRRTSGRTGARSFVMLCVGDSQWTKDHSEFLDLFIMSPLQSALISHSHFIVIRAF